MNTGKCPYCEATVSEVKISTVSCKGPERTYHGISYSCGSCGKVLSVAIDPIAVKSDTVDMVVDRLKNK